MGALTPTEALRALELIDRAVDAVCKTAPAAVEVLGGREAMQRTCQMTCIGPVPRLTTEQWSLMAEEHADDQRAARGNIAYARLSRGREKGPEPRADDSPAVDLGPRFSNIVGVLR